MKDNAKRAGTFYLVGFARTVSLKGGKVSLKGGSASL